MDLIALSYRLWFDSLLSGNAPSSMELELFQEFGRRRVHQGISLSSLLKAFRVGMRELWHKFAELGNECDALRDELLFVISPYMMDYFDSMAELISKAYLDEQYQQARWRQALRHQLHEVIFNYASDDQAFSKTTSALGVDHTVPRIAIAIRSEGLDPGASHSAEEADRVVLAVAKYLNSGRESLIDAWHRERLIVWAPCVRNESANASDRYVSERMSMLLESMSSVASVGVGLAGVGAKGWAASANGAIRALDFARHSALERRLHCYSDIVIEECIRDNESAVNYLISLTKELSSEPDLFLTLTTFFSNMRRRKVTAAALGIHPNTLDHRLERIEIITGARLDEAAWIAKFETAFRLGGMRE